MMRRKTAALYLDLSEAEFMREVEAHRLPQPVLLGNAMHWSLGEIDFAVARITGEQAFGDVRLPVRGFDSFD